MKGGKSSGEGIEREATEIEVLPHILHNRCQHHVGTQCRMGHIRTR